MGNSFSRRCFVICSHADDKAIYFQEKTEAEALEEIKNYYYERYKKTGKLDKLEPWNN